MMFEEQTEPTAPPLPQYETPGIIRSVRRVSPHLRVSRPHPNVISHVSVNIFERTRSRVPTNLGMCGPHSGARKTFVRRQYRNTLGDRHLACANCPANLRGESRRRLSPALPGDPARSPFPRPEPHSGNHHDQRKNRPRHREAATGPLGPPGRALETNGSGATDWNTPKRPKSILHGDQGGNHPEVTKLQSARATPSGKPAGATDRSRYTRCQGAPGAVFVFNPPRAGSISQ